MKQIEVSTRRTVKPPGPGKVQKLVYDPNNLLPFSAELHGYIAENCHEGIWMINAEVQTMYVNRKMAEIIGYDVEELLGGSAFHHIHPDYRETFFQQQQRRSKGQSDQYELCVHHKKGHPIWVIIAATPIQRNGQFAGSLAMVMDITDRKAVELELTQTVQRFHLALQATRDGIWEWDFKRSEMYFSARFCEILGFAADEAELERTYHSWAGRIHPDHREQVDRDLQLHLTTGAPFEVEYLHRHRSGEYRWQKASGQALFDDKGKAFRMAGSIRDISQEKEVERAMRREKEFSDAIINSLPGVFYLLNEKGQLERWNRNLERVSGRSHDEVATMAPLELVTAKDRSLALEVFESALVQGWGNAEIGLEHSDGSVREFFFNGKVLRQGSRHALVGMGVDISERIKTEHRLQLSESKYRMLFDFNPVPLFMVRAKDFKFLDVNYAAMRHYQYTKEELQEMTFGQLKSGLRGTIGFDADMLAERIETHRRKDGQRMQMQVSHHLIEYDNEEALLFLCLDVTDKIKNEELLRRSYEEIRELATHLQDVREVERTAIARDIHDELGQGLTAVRMNLSSILRKPEEAAQNLERIREALAITEQTMASVRKIATDLRPALLDDLGLLEALRWYAESFRRRLGLELEFNLHCADSVIDPKISIVIFRIVQESLTNIARHASASKVTMTLGQEGSALLLSILDNGVGFDVANARKTDSLGMLGLKERAQSIKGEYTVQSRPGFGTVVEVFVPEAFTPNQL